MKHTDLTKHLKSFWHFLWHEDSALSWIVNIVLAFVIIKFIIYPGLGFIVGTNLPVVAVISESMEHNGDFSTWWNSEAACGDQTILTGKYSLCTQKEWYSNKGIYENNFTQYPMHNGFNKGDIILLKGVNYDKIQVGDVIVFQSRLTYPIIHRVIDKNDVIQTKGDHNTKQIVDSKLNEQYITKDQIIGKAWIRVPWLGYIKIWFVDLLRCITFQGCSFK